MSGKVPTGKIHPRAIDTTASHSTHCSKCKRSIPPGASIKKYKMVIWCKRCW